jgi:uncharacterized protein (DUF1778 family)
MAKEDRIAVRLDAQTKMALLKAAADDKRTLSSMVAKILADWIKAHRGGKRG